MLYSIRIYDKPLLKTVVCIITSNIENNYQFIIKQYLERKRIINFYYKQCTSCRSHLQLFNVLMKHFFHSPVSHYFAQLTAIWSADCFLPFSIASLFLGENRIKETSILQPMLIDMENYSNRLAHANVNHWRCQRTLPISTRMVSIQK